VLRQDVPEEALNHERWDIQMNKVMGGGNRMLEVAIADKMMSARAAYPPEAQSDILRLYAGSVTGDWKLANNWVPEMPVVSDSIHDTEIAFGAIMSGSTVTPRPGLNAIEVIETMLRLMGGKVQQILQTTGMGTPQDVQGLQMSAQYTAAFIQQLSMDQTQSERIKQYGDVLGKMMNEVKAFAQRQQQAAQQASQQNGVDPKDAAKAQATVALAQTKAQIASDSHAQRTAQKQLAFEQKQRQDAEKHALEMQKETAALSLELQAEQARNQLELEKKAQQPPEGI
jgi:hypothetical protein